MPVIKPKGLKMKVAEIIVPEYAGERSFDRRLPASQATNKSDYIKLNRATIAKMDTEIARLEDLVQKTTADNSMYQTYTKRLNRCRDIKQNCEASIRLATAQMSSGVTERFCNSWR